MDQLISARYANQHEKRKLTDPPKKPLGRLSFFFSNRSVASSTVGIYIGGWMDLMASVDGMSEICDGGMRSVHSPLISSVPLV